MQIEHYQTETGRDIVHEWLAKLRDARALSSIIRRLDRIRQGNFGDHKYCRDGVSELRIDVGPGYRVYYGVDGEEIVLLLCAGDKRTQSKDIDNAVSYWTDYQTRKADGHIKQ